MSDELTLKELAEWPAFSLTKEDKAAQLHPALKKLSLLHENKCEEYARLLASFSGFNKSEESGLQSVFPLPVRLFKTQELKSVPQDEVIKTMTSSGTTGQQRSQIFLDKETSVLQVKILSKIMTDFIGPKRLPMLIIDCPSTVRDRKKFSARTTGILGFSMYGRDLTFALNDDMSINHQAVEAFIGKYQDQDCLVFGFTYVVWLHFIQQLGKTGTSHSLSKGVLIHGGGWKQLSDQAVSIESFKSRIFDATQISKIHNYYGMVEQTGSIFMECEEGHFHCSSWSDILIREPVTLNIQPVGQSGLIQLFSVLPRSYPGHSILSEDIGQLLGEDDCPCGRKGVYFVVEGRMKQAEIRGCSDTYTQ